DDGIRDFHVTGVQTCALPILPSSPSPAAPAAVSSSASAESSAGSSGPPTSTRQYRIGFLNSVSSSISATLPTTSGPVTLPTCSTPSTSTPRFTNASTSPSGVTSSPSSRCSVSQLTGTRTTPPWCCGAGASGFRSGGGTRRGPSRLRAERDREPDVTLHHVPHV